MNTCTKRDAIETQENNTCNKFLRTATAILLALSR
jgi:hypothetical protein